MLLFGEALRDRTLFKFDASVNILSLTIADTPLPPTHQARWSVETHTHTHYSDISWDVLNKHVSLYTLTSKHSIWWLFLVGWSDQNFKQPEVIIKHNICGFWDNAWCTIISTMSWVTRNLLETQKPQKLSSWQFLVETWSPIAREADSVEADWILYQWLKPRLWLFTLRATSSCKNDGLLQEKWNLRKGKGKD